LFDTDGETVAEITTDGSTLKPFLNAVRQVVDECRIHFEDDGLRVTAVDPANVFMIDVRLPASAFEEYTRPTGTRAIGVNVGSLRYAIRRARMGSDDTLSIKVAERRFYAHVDREYDDGATLVTEDQIDLIDPDSVRAEPDVPELDLTPLDVSREAFEDATEYARADFSDYLEYDTVDGDLHVTTNGDTASSRACLEGATDGNHGHLHGLYSSSYIGSKLDVVRKSKADTLSIELGDSFPIRFDFERTGDDGETILSGETLLAPRIKSDGPETGA